MRREGSKIRGKFSVCSTEDWGWRAADLLGGWSQLSACACEPWQAEGRLLRLSGNSSLLGLREPPAPVWDVHDVDSMAAQNRVEFLPRQLTQECDILTHDSLGPTTGPL